MRTKETVIRQSEKVLSKNPGVCSSEVERLVSILSRGPFDMRHGDWKPFGANESQNKVINDMYNEGLTIAEFQRAVLALSK